MANPFEVQVPNALAALMAFDQGYSGMRGMMNDREQAEARRAAQEELLKGETNNALARLIGAGDTKSAGVLAQYQAGANSVYGTPIYGTMPDGTPAIGSFDKRGQFRTINTGGFTPTPGVKTINTPQGEYVIDSKSGRAVGGAAPAAGAPTPGQAPGFYPKDYRTTEADKRIGAETGEKATKMGQAKLALDSSSAALDRLAAQANEVAGHSGLGGIFGIPGMFWNIPGGRAADAQAKLDTLKSQVGFAVLQAMREASKTGGALGQVSDFENRQLQNNLAELQQSQSVDQVKRALKKIVDWASGTKDRLKAAYDTDYGGLRRPDQATQPGVMAGGSQASQQTWTDPATGKSYIVRDGKLFAP